MSAGWLPDGVEPWEIPLLEVAECEPVRDSCALLEVHEVTAPDEGTTGPLF